MLAHSDQPHHLIASTQCTGIPLLMVQAPLLVPRFVPACPGTDPQDLAQQQVAALVAQVCLLSKGVCMALRLSATNTVVRD